MIASSLFLVDSLLTLGFDPLACFCIIPFFTAVVPPDGIAGAAIAGAATAGAAPGGGGGG